MFVSLLAVLSTEYFPVKWSSVRHMRRFWFVINKDCWTATWLYDFFFQLGKKLVRLLRCWDNNFLVGTLSEPLTMSRVVSAVQIRRRHLWRPSKKQTTFHIGGRWSCHGSSWKPSSYCWRDDEVGLSKSSCQETLANILEMQRVAAKFVPWLLTDEHKANCLAISQEVLNYANANEIILKNDITDDKT